MFMEKSVSLRMESGGEPKGGKLLQTGLGECGRGGGWSYWEPSVPTPAIWIYLKAADIGVLLAAE
jgi:hypothetical protein